MSIPESKDSLVNIRCRAPVPHHTTGLGQLLIEHEPQKPADPCWFKYVLTIPSSSTHSAVVIAFLSVNTEIQCITPFRGLIICEIILNRCSCLSHLVLGDQPYIYKDSVRRLQHIFSPICLSVLLILQHVYQHQHHFLWLDWMDWTVFFFFPAVSTEIIQKKRCTLGGGSGEERRWTDFMHDFSRQDYFFFENQTTWTTATKGKKAVKSHNKTAFTTKGKKVDTWLWLVTWLVVLWGEEPGIVI